MPCAWLLDSLIYKCSLAGLTAGWSSEVWRRWSTRTGWPRMKTFGSHRSGVSKNKFRNCLGIKIFVFFFKLSGSTTQRTRQQRWTTQSLGRQSKNLAALKYPHLQGASIISKKEEDLQHWIFSLENMQQFEGSENKLTQTRTYNINFICTYDLTWCVISFPII